MSEANMKQIKLVITADDLGYNPERDRGIIECYQRGAVSRSSLLVNGVSAKEAAKEASLSGLPLGLHFNITEGISITAAHEIQSLLTENGFFKGMFGFRESLSRGEVVLEDVKVELISQIESFKQLTGTFPEYVDGHQHCHVLPDIADVFASTLEQYNIKHSRLPYEPLISSCPWLTQEMHGFFVSVVSDSLLAKPPFDNHSIKYPDSFVGLGTMGLNMTTERIKDIITSANAPDKTRDPIVASCELMSHPGYACLTEFGGCGIGPDDFSKSTDREHEMNILSSDELKEFYRTNNIFVVNGVDYN